MAQAHPKLALRPFLPADASLLREIFRASIEQLTADDYSEAQQQAWSSAADDEAAFGKDLGSHLTLVATLSGSPVGFATLAGGNRIDMLYVHPEAAGQGVGNLLIDALEKLAGSRGAVRRLEIPYGYFERRIRLPEVHLDAAIRESIDGCLILRLRKTG
jgi:putative acetyltransferase